MAADYRTKQEAFDAGVTEGIRQATAAHRMGTDVMDPQRLTRAVRRMVTTDRFSAGDLMGGSITPQEFAVELARRYNAEPPS